MLSAPRGRGVWWGQSMGQAFGRGCPTYMVYEWSRDPEAIWNWRQIGRLAALKSQLDDDPYLSTIYRLGHWVRMLQSIDCVSCKIFQINPPKFPCKSINISIAGWSYHVLWRFHHLFNPYLITPPLPPFPTWPGPQTWAWPKLGPQGPNRTSCIAPTNDHGTGPTSCPLVNLHNYGKSPFFHGKTHYFYGHVQ